MQPEEIDSGTSLRDYGLDSLAALLLRNQVLNDLPQVRISVARFIDGPPLHNLAEEILAQIEPASDTEQEEWEEGVL